MKFKYKNDTIELNLWAWVMRHIFGKLHIQPAYRSTNFEFEFFSFRDYWVEVGKRGALVHFISSKIPGKYGPKYYTGDEVMQRIARLDLGDTSGVVIANIDQSRLDRLMLLFAGVDSNVFRHGEMIVLPTQNKEAAYKLTQAIPLSMADVIGFTGGYMFCDNNDVE